MKTSPNEQVTIYLPKVLNEALRKLSFYSRKSKSALIAEAINIFIKTPGGKK